MKKLLIVLLLVGIAPGINAQSYPPGKSDFAKSAAFMAKLDLKCEALKAEIRHTPTTLKVNGKTYFVAEEGNDSNNGLSAATPVKTLDKVNALELQEGDAVLFRRGDLWRGSIKSKKGVTYSAYGKGPKPRIYGSPCDAAKEGSWLETGTPHVYVYDRELSKDVGTLVFNDGESCAIKVMKQHKPDGSTLNLETQEPFRDYRDLKDDLTFYHDYTGKRRLYLCSWKGNPSKRFKSIELLVKTNIIYATDNVTIDNLCLKYCGAHGIGSGTTKGLTVTNCELGWIGGSVQGESLFGRDHPTRYGNAIEVYGGCDFYLVDHCYIYQVYDAGITHQYSRGKGPLTMKNVTYSHNLVEDCVYAVEYFLGESDDDAVRQMKNIRITDNIFRRSGFGWGKQRPDKTTPALIKSWSHYNRASDFVIANNIFDRGNVELLNIGARKKEWLPILKHNTYIQYINKPAGKCGTGNEVYLFDGNIRRVLKNLFGEKSAKIFYVAPLEKAG